MAMHKVAWTALAAGLMTLAGSGSARANDTVRLLDNTDRDRAADVDGDTDTHLVYRRGGFGYGGGYGRGFGYGGYGRGFGYGGYGRGFYGGYGRGYGYGYGRGFYGSYYRPFISIGIGGYGYGGYGYGGYYQPYYGVSSYSSYYYPSYYSSYYPGYYSYPSYSYAPIYAPCSTTVTEVTTAPQVVTVTPSTPSYSVAPSTSYSQIPAPRVLAPAGDGTFPYDGGPRNPLPMPGPDGDANPMSAPRKTVPLDGRLVSLPKQTTGGVTPVGDFFVSLRTDAASQPVRIDGPATPSRYTFPAYGEQNLPPVTRTRTK